MSDFAVEPVDGAAEAAGRAQRRAEHHGHGGTQDAGISAVVAQGVSQSGVGDAITARIGDALAAATNENAVKVLLTNTANKFVFRSKDPGT